MESALEQKEGHVPPTLAVTSKLRHSQDIEVKNFEYLKSIIRELQIYTTTPSSLVACAQGLHFETAADQHHAIKITIPSPTMLHFRGGRKAISEDAYPNLDDFFSDLAKCYRQEIDALYKAGCRYLQLDDTK